MLKSISVLLVLLAGCATLSFADRNKAAGWASSGRGHMDSGHYGEAIECFESAIKEDPTYADAYEGLAKAYDATGKPAEAAHAREQAKTMGRPESKPAGPPAVAAGKYGCVAFMNGMIQGLANSGFEIKSGGIYFDNHNVKGAYTYDPAQSLVTFKGASRNGQTALFGGVAGKRPVLQIYNAQHSRTVYDCLNDSWSK